ncbi:MAG: hypothetical protein QXO78_05340 [Desulfurococcaceae archaeon]|uniref:Uncharacterized protein n=1 Tax=Staphylothermus marinus TaxID=2280 RepID=A0A7C4NPF0_STAMA
MVKYRYMVVRNDKVVGIYDDFIEAFKRVVETPGSELYRIELVMSMKEEEASSVKDLLTAEIEPVEAPIGRVRAVKKIVVLDPETAPGEFLNLIDSFENIEFYVNSKIVDEETRSRINVSIYDADSEEDFIRFLKTVSLKGNVILVTSSKKLYVKSLGIKSVKSVFRLPDERIEDVLVELLKS